MAWDSRGYEVGQQYMNELTRVCRVCKQDKFLDELVSCKTCKYGKDLLCKKCQIIYAKEYFIKNPLRNRAYAKGKDIALYYMYNSRYQQKNIITNKVMTLRPKKIYKEWESGFNIFKNWAFENGFQQGYHMIKKDSNGENNPLNVFFSKKINCNRHLCKKNLTKSSKYVGVCYDKYRNKWVAQIGINHKSIKLGRFEIEEDARDVYLNAVAKYCPEKA